MRESQGLSEALAFLRSGVRRFLLTSHARPDGDAIGSVLGLSFVLEQMGLESDIVLADPVPAVYRALPGVERIREATDVHNDESPVIVLECDSTQRTGLLGLDGRPLLNIDHHASGRRFGSANWIDPTASAVGVMIHQLAVAAGVRVTPEMASALYIAVLSDTNAFTNGATDAATLALAASLARDGADPAALARQVFANTESRLRLLGMALCNMQRSGRIAWTSISLEEMKQTGADLDECEGIVNYLISIPDVDSAVFLRELPTGRQFRLSLRSKGAVDVAEVAETFGGGGHRTASGCTLDGPLAHATRQILQRLESSFGVGVPATVW